MASLKVIIAIIALFNYKCVPLAYFFRFYYRIVKILVIPRWRYLHNGRQNTFGILGKDNMEVFSYRTMDSRVLPMEIDMYLHKSNSTYFIDLDMARTELVCSVFQKLFYDYFDNVKGEFKARRQLSNLPYVPVATVKCVFKKELTLFQKYQIKSKVLAWDEKWLFILSKFVIQKKGKEVLCALAVTKYVFKKNGRMTIKPEEFIKDCNLWSVEAAAENKKNYELIKYLKSSEDLEDVCFDLEKL